MRSGIRITRRARQTLLSVVGACIAGYFLYYTVQGDRGWFSMLRLRHEVSSAKEDLSQLQKEREKLQRRTKLLRPDSIDPDLLEETSREMMNYSKPDEIVVIETPPEAAKEGGGVVQRKK